MSLQNVICFDLTTDLVGQLVHDAIQLYFQTLGSLEIEKKTYLYIQFYSRLSPNYHPESLHVCQL